MLNGSVLPIESREPMRAVLTGSFLIRGGLMVTNVAIGLLLARILGPTEYGRYAYIISLALLLTVPASMGLPTTILRECSRAIAQQNWQLVNGTLILAAVSPVCFSLVVVGAVLMVLPYVGDVWQTEFRTPLLAGLILIPAGALISTLGDFLRGLGRVLLGQLGQLLRQLILLVVVLAVLGTSESILDSVTALRANSMAAVVAAGVSLLCALRCRTAEMVAASSKLMLRPWLASSMAFAAITAIHTVNNRMDVLLVGTIMGASSAGIYEVGFRCAEVLLFAPVTVNITYAAFMSRLFSGRQFETLRSFVLRSTRILFVVTLALGVLLAVFAESLIVLLFGHEYRDAAWPLRILVVGHVYNVFVGPVDLLLNMAGHEGRTVLGVTLAAVANIVLNLVLIPPFGIVGACIATTFSTFIWNTLLMLSVRKLLGFNPCAISLSRSKSGL